MCAAGIKKEPPPTELGERLYKIRLEMNMSVNEFADAFKIPSSTVSSIENGTRNTSNTVIKLLVDLFGEDIFGEFITEVKCKWCGKKFIPDNQHKVFCSRECGVKFGNLRGGGRFWYEYSTPDTLSEIAKEEAQARELGISYGKFQQLKRGYLL